MPKYTTIAVTPALKDRINQLRGNMTVQDYVSSLISYFDATGIDPISIQICPWNKIFDRIDASIQIIKNIEREKINPILKGVRSLGAGAVDDKSNAVVEGVTIQELQAVIDQNESFKKQLIEARNTITRLEKEALSPSLKVDKSKLYEELLDALLSKNNYQSKSGSGDLYISSFTVDAYKKRYIDIKNK